MGSSEHGQGWGLGPEEYLSAVARDSEGTWAGRWWPRASPSWAHLNAWLMYQTLGRVCERLLLQMKRDHRGQTEACLGRGLPASSVSPCACVNSMDRQKEHRLAVLVRFFI